MELETVAFASRSMIDTKQRYAQNEMEACQSFGHVICFSLSSLERILRLKLTINCLFLC